MRDRIIEGTNKYFPLVVKNFAFRPLPDKPRQQDQALLLFVEFRRSLKLKILYLTRIYYFYRDCQRGRKCPA